MSNETGKVRFPFPGNRSSVSLMENFLGTHTQPSTSPITVDDDSFYWKFGPLEYAILGNGAVLVLLLFILGYTIYRLRKIAFKKNTVKRRIVTIDPESALHSHAHQHFSTLCGLPPATEPPKPSPNPSSSRMPMDGFRSQTLPKKVRIHHTEESGSFLIAPPQPQPLWIAFPHHHPHHPQAFMPFTLNIPVQKGHGHRCQRTQSCRIPSILPATGNPGMHSKTLKPVNLDQFYGKF